MFDYVNGFSEVPGYDSYEWIPVISTNIALIKKFSGDKMPVLRKALEMNLVDFIPFMKDNIEKYFILECTNGHLEIVKKLYKMKEIDVSDGALRKSNPLVAVCEGSHVKVVRFLLSLPNVNFNLINRKIQFQTPLIVSVGKNIKIFKMLLDRPEIDINQTCTKRDTGTALTAAVRSGKIGFVEFLLTRKKLGINAAPVTHHIDMFTLDVSFVLILF